MVIGVPLKTHFPRILTLIGVSSLLAGIFVPAIHTLASSTPEFLDSTFGTNGIVRADYNDGYGEEIRDMVLQPDGKIVAAVEENCQFACPNKGFAVVRHNANGTLDHTFNGTGFVRIPAGQVRADAEAIALQTDGKIVVAGTSQDVDRSGRFAMARLHANGTPDLDFGINGVVITDLATPDEDVLDIAIQPDGKIVLVGRNEEFGTTGLERRWVVIRYNADGTLDTDFAPNGTGVYNPLTHLGWATSVALQPDGKIIVAGQKASDVSVLRLNEDGSPDLTFGTAGYASVDLSSNSIAADVAVQPDGKIVATGEYDRNASPLMFVVRLTATGFPDNSFGAVGYIQPNWGYSEIDINRIVIDSDNKVLITGVAQFPNNEDDIFLTRFNIDGSWDTHFYSTGHIRLEDPGDEEALAMVLTAEGMVLIAGRDDITNPRQALLLRINSAAPRVMTTPTIAPVPTSTNPVVVRAAATTAPTSVSYRAANKRVTLRWGAVSSAASYVVTTTRGVQVCATTATSCVVNRLRNGRAYSYNVFAVNADGVRSATSTRVSARPGFQVKRTTVKTKRSVSLSSIVTTPSKGRKTWTVTSGACRINGARLVTATKRGSCKLRLSTAKSGAYGAMSTTINVWVR